MRLYFRLAGWLDALLIRIVKIAAYFGRRASVWRLARVRPRSLWGVTPILTLPLLARCDRVLGFRSSSLVFTTYIITSRFDINLRWLVAGINRISHHLNRPAHRLLLAWALLRYDVFHYFADRGLMPSRDRFGIDPWELQMLRAAGKRVYIYGYGADVRTRAATLELGKWNFCVDCVDHGKFCICDDAKGQANMEVVAANTTALVALGDMLTYMPGARHIDYWPIALDEIALAPPPSINGPLRIVHAPNHTHFKGSTYLESAIERARARGWDIDYVKVQGVPNEEVMRLFEGADLVADQFIGGAYGYTALEAMARGKPVLTYVRTPDLVVSPEECPLFNANPDTLDNVLEWVLKNRPRLPEIGAQGRRYIERWYDITAVARRMARLYAETAGFEGELGSRLKSVADELPPDISREVVSWSHPWMVMHRIADLPLQNSIPTAHGSDACHHSGVAVQPSIQSLIGFNVESDAAKNLSAPVAATIERSKSCEKD